MKEQHELVAGLVPFLLSRGYGPNERAPSERELAERFQVSRPQVREALSVLEALRLIERRPKSGIYMTTELASIEALRLFAEVGIPLSRDEDSQIVEVRRIQELEAIRLACRRLRAENIEALQACLRDWEAAIEGDGPIAELDRVFHCELVKATQNTVLLRLVNIFYLMTERRREFFFGRAERRKQSFLEHQKIFEAVLARDEGRAVELLDAHLESADSYWQDLRTS
jgi:GntR family transcriptional regulator, transcriptional repressor for pyruvate dehydrogenase complex